MPKKLATPKQRELAEKVAESFFDVTIPTDTEDGSVRMVFDENTGKTTRLLYRGFCEARNIALQDEMVTNQHPLVTQVRDAFRRYNETRKSQPKVQHRPGMVSLGPHMFVMPSPSDCVKIIRDSMAQWREQAYKEALGLAILDDADGTNFEIVETAEGSYLAFTETVNYQGKEIEAPEFDNEEWDKTVVQARIIPYPRSTKDNVPEIKLRMANELTSQNPQMRDNFIKTVEEVGDLVTMLGDAEKGEVTQEMLDKVGFRVAGLRSYLDGISATSSNDTRQPETEGAVDPTL